MSVLDQVQIGSRAIRKKIYEDRRKKRQSGVRRSRKQDLVRNESNMSILEQLKAIGAVFQHENKFSFL